MNELLRILTSQGRVFPLQLILLVVDGYLVVTDRASSFLMLSIIILASIFVLQTTRGRFLLLHPRNSWAGRETSEWDTYYLSFIAALATFFTFLGLYFGITDTPDKLAVLVEAYLNQPIFQVIWAVLFVVAIPLIFAFYSNQLNERMLMVFCMIHAQELLGSSERSSEQSKRKSVSPKSIKVW